MKLAAAGLTLLLVAKADAAPSTGATSTGSVSISASVAPRHWVRLAGDHSPVGRSMPALCHNSNISRQIPLQLTAVPMVDGSAVDLPRALTLPHCTSGGDAVAQTFEKHSNSWLVILGVE